MISLEPRVHSRWLRIRESAVAHGGLLRRGFWALADQGLISATNFALMIVLARALGPRDFGTFTLTYTVILFANGFQSALVTQPHNVIGATKSGEAYRRYTSSTAFGQMAFTAILTCPAVILAVIAVIQGWSAAAILVALVPAIAAWQVQEFGRRVFYTEGRYGAACFNDAVSYGGQLIVVGVLWVTFGLTSARALFIIAATSVLAAIIGGWQLRSNLAGKLDRNTLHENWTFGKWLGAANIGYWTSSQLYLYLAAIFLGSAATGAVKAAQVLMRPLTILLNLFDTVLPIRFSRAFTSGGAPELETQMRRYGTLAAAPVVAYCVIISVFGPKVMWILYGKEYEHYGPLPALFAVYTLVGFLIQIASSALMGRQQTRSIFIAYAVASGFTVLFGWLLIRLASVQGTVIGYIVSASIVACILWRQFLVSNPESTHDGSQMGVP